jgi:hypothetical protein
MGFVLMHAIMCGSNACAVVWRRVAQLPPTEAPAGLCDGLAGKECNTFCE